MHLELFKHIRLYLLLIHRTKRNQIFVYCLNSICTRVNWVCWYQTSRLRIIINMSGFKDMCIAFFMIKKNIFIWAHSIMPCLDQVEKSRVLLEHVQPPLVHLLWSRVWPLCLMSLVVLMLRSFREKEQHIAIFAHDPYG